MEDRFRRLVASLTGAGVRFVLIGVAGANYYATSGAEVFTTRDRDLFVPPDPDATLRAWRSCEDAGLTLWCAAEPLDTPRDRQLAEAVIGRCATVRATDREGLAVDLTYVMAGFDFETVWASRREFVVEGIAIPVARLRQIIESKARLGRDKDRLFLAAHADALEQLFPRDD